MALPTQRVSSARRILKRANLQAEERLRSPFQPTRSSDPKPGPNGVPFLLRLRTSPAAAGPRLFSSHSSVGLDESGHGCPAMREQGNPARSQIQGAATPPPTPRLAQITAGGIPRLAFPGSLRVWRRARRERGKWVPAGTPSLPRLSPPPTGRGEANQFSTSRLAPLQSVRALLPRLGGPPRRRSTGAMASAGGGEGGKRATSQSRSYPPQPKAPGFWTLGQPLPKSTVSPAAGKNVAAHGCLGTHARRGRREGGGEGGRCSDLGSRQLERRRQAGRARPPPPS